MKSVLIAVLVALMAIIGTCCASIKLGSTPELISARTYNANGIPDTPKITAVVPRDMFLVTATPKKSLGLNATMIIKDKRTKAVLFIIVRDRPSKDVFSNLAHVLYSLDIEFHATHSEEKGYRLDYESNRAGYKTNNRTIIRESAFSENVVLCEAYSFKGGGTRILDELEEICQSVKLAK